MWGRQTCACCVLALGAALGVGAPVAVAQDVGVQFRGDALDPDPGESRKHREQVVDFLAGLIREAATDCIEHDQTLSVTVSGLRLSGREPLHDNPEQTRRASATDWPRMDVEWTLKNAHGHVVASESETLTDREYLERHAIRGSARPLPAEHHMVREWVSRSVCSP
ncbi:DUF3016 domain-containing protein [Aquisalimonas asiatica]|uniref:DUF3016 domain-containing protein n=1 Tax=Aquisalimonas asiatica TaxID=406100 RepID=A0A1H8S547_9GAMM|nr:Protein of unknown function [Aquisalimonas asiatica]